MGGGRRFYWCGVTFLGSTFLCRVSQSQKRCSWGFSRARRKASVQSFHSILHPAIRVHQSMYGILYGHEPCWGREAYHLPQESQELGTLEPREGGSFFPRSLYIQVTHICSGHAYPGQLPIPGGDSHSTQTLLGIHLNCLCPVPSPIHQHGIYLESIKRSFLAKLQKWYAYIQSQPPFAVK